MRVQIIDDAEKIRVMFTVSHDTATAVERLLVAVQGGGDSLFPADDQPLVKELAREREKRALLESILWECLNNKYIDLDEVSPSWLTEARRAVGLD